MDSMRSLLSTSDFLQVREHKLSNDLTVWLNEDILFHKDTFFNWINTLTFTSNLNKRANLT